MLKDSVEGRRRLAVHLGLVALLIVSISFVTTACIFDQGSGYQGGGHLPQGATAQSSTSSSSSSSSGDDDDQSSSSGTNTVLLDSGQSDAF